MPNNRKGDDSALLGVPCGRIAAGEVTSTLEELSSATWWLIPAWAKDRKIASSLINARAETVSVKPAFRSAYKKRRCLIPADGFYEWKRVGDGKIPHRIAVGDGMFYFAGLWEMWNDPEAGPLRTCTIITCEPNALMAEIHNRMPVILPPESRSAWLGRETPPEQLAGLLVAHAPETMKAYAVSTRVNTPRNQESTLIEPAGAD
jgi:putative SOS response-associated peptidase YedK